MTSPSSTSGSSARSGAPTRRRQRSTRVVVACTLLSVAAGLVLLAIVAGSWLVLVMAAVAGVALGAAATRITVSELADSRRHAAADRACLARQYRAASEVAADDHAVFVTFTNGRIARHEATIGRLESRLAEASAEAAEAHRLLEAERTRAETAESARARLLDQVAEAETRAAEAIVRLAELEHELDVVLDQWRSALPAPARKHA